ncbi:MAG: hypothetical protein ACYC36_13330 [Bellilinea sp.]
MTIEFGEYVAIEQRRFFTENEFYLHKVIGELQSNTWVEVPVETPCKETTHKEMADVVACVCCGVSEREIFRYRVADVKKEQVGYSAIGKRDAEIERLREALASVANFGGAHIEVGEGSGKTLVWDEPSYGQTNIAIEALLKGGGDE